VGGDRVEVAHCSMDRLGHQSEAAGIRIEISSPSGSQRYSMVPLNWLSTVRRVKVPPKPVLVGADAAGPPRSLHLSSSTSDTVQAMRSFPVGCFKAPYLAAFVANSCRIR